MRSRLTGRGIEVLALGCLFAAAGAAVERPYLVTLGGAALAVLIVQRVRAAAGADRLAAGRLRLSWRVDRPEGRRALSQDRPFWVEVDLNDDGAGFASARVGAYASSVIEVEPAPAVTLGRGLHRIKLSLRSRAVGNWWLHGALVTLNDELGLFATQAFFPTPQRVRVLPALPVRRALPGAGAGDGHGQRRQRSDGHGSDLAEIREAVPGDPYRHVAWKATARTGRLMVRRFRSESPIDRILCLDLAMGGARDRHLDRAIAALASHARAALAAGDRVGLVAFDERIRAHVPPGDRHKHLGLLIDELLALRSRPDDSTLGDAEAIAAVAWYLSWEEGCSLRVAPPPLDSARWDDLVAGPSGDLYEGAELDRRVLAILAREAPGELRAAPQRIDRVRALIRARGLETPPRGPLDPAARLRALDEAVRLADRPQRGTIVLWTDLDVDLVARRPSVKRARSRHRLALASGAGGRPAGGVGAAHSSAA